MTDELLKYLSEVSNTKVLKPFNAQEAILFTDVKKSYQVFANVGKMTLVQLVPLIITGLLKKVYRIQNVNDYESRLKGWMNRFKEVATKNLLNNMGWKRFLEKHKKAELLEQDNYRTVYQLTFKEHSRQERNYYLFDRGILVKVDRAKK